MKVEDRILAISEGSADPDMIVLALLEGSDPVVDQIAKLGAGVFGAMGATKGLLKGVAQHKKAKAAGQKSSLAKSVGKNVVTSGAHAGSWGYLVGHATGAKMRHQQREKSGLA